MTATVSLQNETYWAFELQESSLELQERAISREFSQKLPQVEHRPSACNP